MGSSPAADQHLHGPGAAWGHHGPAKCCTDPGCAAVSVLCVDGPRCSLAGSWHPLLGWLLFGPHPGAPPHITHPSVVLGFVPFVSGSICSTWKGPETILYYLHSLSIHVSLISLELPREKGQQSSIFIPMGGSQFFIMWEPALPSVRLCPPL